MSGAAGTPASGLRTWLVRLRGRPDSEHEMSFNRLAIVGLMLSYVLAANPQPGGIPLLLFYLFASLAVFVHILTDQSVRVARRLMMMTLDMTVVSYVMHANGGYAALFWPIYLWVAFGNGFRFGIPYIYAAVAVAVIAFGGVICTTDFWWDASALSVGLLIGLVALPLYAATLIRKLSRATAEAEEASRAKSYFLASVSHELRTPLTAIIGLGAHLHASETDAERRAMADTIVSAGRSLLNMINRLLDYSRIEAHGVAAEAKPFDLTRLLAGVRELMRFQAAEKGLALNLHVAADTPTALLGDDGHIHDVLVNLVGNAIKFTESGAVTIVAGADRDAAGGLRLRLTVADTGIGIAAEAQPHIFGSFRQADDTIIDRYGGTGLGLAICKQLVEVMGGEIGVDSRPGEGSRFWFTVCADTAADPPPAAVPDQVPLLLYSHDPALAERVGRGVIRRESRPELRALLDTAAPAVVLIDARTLAAEALPPPDFSDIVGRGAVGVLLADADDLLPPREWLERGFATCVARTADAAMLDRAVGLACALAGGTAGSLREMAAAHPRAALRVLVADDNQMNQKVFGMILGRAGHEVFTAGDGEAALDLMKDHSFDVVLMDVNMPVLNGIEATRLYRFAALGRRHVPIVGVTADASPATAGRCVEAGMDACIAKPIEAEPLLDLIDELVRREAEPPAPVPAFDPAGVVTPLFRASGQPEEPPVDWRSLEELEELGGDAFVTELLDMYLNDAETLLGALATAVATGDVAEFRSTAHALRSSAANVGALRVAEMCQHYQRIGEDEFARDGARLHRTLGDELVRVAQALARRPDTRAAG